MKQIIADPALIACCGLYCGACRGYRADKCPGCLENAKAGWCRVRTCCIDHGRRSCADCGEFGEVRLCKKFNNPISRLVGFIFRSNRGACIDYIRKEGGEKFAAEMTAQKRHSFRR